MQLPKEELKNCTATTGMEASNMFSLQEEAKYQLKEGIAVKLILNGVSNEVISLSTDLPVDRIEELKSELNK